MESITAKEANTAATRKSMVERVLVLALITGALVLTFCSQWHAATVVLWALSAMQSLQSLRSAHKRAHP